MSYNFNRFNRFISKFEPYSDTQWEDYRTDPKESEQAPYSFVKLVGRNGHWAIVKYRGDSAYYSVCYKCGYIYPCYNSNINDPNKPLTEYSEEKEFNYCPVCGELMLEDK